MLKAFVVVAQWNCLNETLPLSTHIGLDTLLSRTKNSGIVEEHSCLDPEKSVMGGGGS